jgi:hypothetical protein
MLLTSLVINAVALSYLYKIKVLDKTKAASKKLSSDDEILNIVKSVVISGHKSLKLVPTMTGFIVESECPAMGTKETFYEGIMPIEKIMISMKHLSQMDVSLMTKQQGGFLYRYNKQNIQFTTETSLKNHCETMVINLVIPSPVKDS